MRQTTRYLFLLQLLLCSLVTYAQAVPPEDDEFNIFLLVVGTIFICGMIGAAIIGAALATFVVLVIAGMAAAGVLSASVLIGWQQRSLKKGFKAFLCIALGAGCAIIGAIGTGIAQSFFHWPITWNTALGIGAAAGLCAGLILAVIFYKMAGLIISTIATKLR